MQMISLASTLVFLLEMSNMWVTTSNIIKWGELEWAWCREAPLAAAFGLNQHAHASKSPLSRHFSGQRCSTSWKHQCYFVLAAWKACLLCQLCAVPYTHLPLYVNKVNHKPQQATCQLHQPGLGAEPKLCCASVKLSITSWHRVKHQLKHYTKHKHFNLISWLLNGYAHSKTTESSFSSRDQEWSQQRRDGGLRLLGPKLCSFQKKKGDVADILNWNSLWLKLHKVFVVRNLRNVI